MQLQTPFWTGCACAQPWAAQQSILIYNLNQYCAARAGHYVTEDISAAYLQSLESSVRTQVRKRSGEKVALVA